MFPLIYDMDLKIKITTEKPKIHEYMLDSHEADNILHSWDLILCLSEFQERPNQKNYDDLIVAF